MDSARDFAAIADTFRNELSFDAQEALHELGTVLRDADARSSPEIRGLLPLVLAAFPRHPRDVLRVLVNYVADNLENRRQVLQEDDFWSRALQLSPARHVNESSLFSILINQYIRSVEPDDLSSFVSRLCERGCQQWVIEYYRQLWREIDQVHSLEELDFERPLEFVKEWSRLMPERVAAGEFMEGYGHFAVMAGNKVPKSENVVGSDIDNVDDIDDINDMLLASSEILYNCTNVQDSTIYTLGPLVELLSIPIPSKLPQYLNIRRNLFAACGNVSSYPTYKNSADIGANLARISESSDPYVVSACAISLGNCISSTEQQQQFLASHNGQGLVARALLKILQMNFMDVIQYQAFHFFNNVLTTALARDIVAADNARHLMRQTKVIADNSNYYKDVATLYLKFLRKLTTLGFQSSPYIDFLPYSEAYEYLLPVEDAIEVEMLVLQVMSRTKTPRVADFKKELVEKVLKMDTTVSAAVLLLKIKTLAIFIKSHTAEEVYELYDNDLSDYLSRMQNFADSLASSTNQQSGNTEADVVANNIKFIVISIKGHVEDVHACRNEYEEQVSQIVSSCMELVGARRT